MKNLITAARAFITYIEDGDVYDTADDDGDGHIDYSQSHTLKELTEELKEAIDAITELPDVMKARKLIRDCFFELIDKQVKQP